MYTAESSEMVQVTLQALESGAGSMYRSYPAARVDRSGRKHTLKLESRFGWEAAQWEAPRVFIASINNIIVEGKGL